MHYLRLKQALIGQQLKRWPYAGKIGIKEFNADNGKSSVHVFEHWRYLGSVENIADCADLLTGHSDFYFDLDSYKLLLKELGKPKLHIIQLSI